MKEQRAYFKRVNEQHYTGEHLEVEDDRSGVRNKIVGEELIVKPPDEGDERKANRNAPMSGPSSVPQLAHSRYEAYTTFLGMRGIKAVCSR